MDDLRPGDVVKMLDSALGHHRVKRLICVCPNRLLFLRINSRDIWRPNCVLTVTQCPSLKYDSHVLMRELLSYDRDDMAEASRMGQISAEAFDYLAKEAQVSETMTLRQKRLVWEMFIEARP